MAPNGPQTSLFAEAALERHESLVAYLAGFAARYAYGENPNAEQRRAARAEAETFARQIVSLRENR